MHSAHTRRGPRHCPCCGKEEGRGDIRAFTCRCTWQFCRDCLKCRAHCQCKPAQKSIANMLQCPYHYCHMATNVLHSHLEMLPYGNERELNDGRRTSSTSQGSRVEPAQAEAQRAGISLCAKMEVGRDLHRAIIPVAVSNRGRGAEEDRNCVRVVDIFSVASQLAAYRLEPGSAANCYLMLPYVYYSQLCNDSQQIATNRPRRYNWQGVAGGVCL